ncbi:MAG: hypothetical protein IH991_11265 [Planctomycetes bacterium]|nr:hypothetical protein [Planctomycetota bacterium]
MPKKSQKRVQPMSPLLRQLCDKYPDHPALKDEAIYALPRDLIKEIEKEGSFFTAQESKFEIDLAEASGGGFFLGEPFGYLSLSNTPTLHGDEETERRFESAVTSIKQMLTEDRLAAGFKPEAVKAAMEPDPKTDRKILERREGFAGWLVTSDDFRAQRDALYNEFHREVKKLGRFPPFIPSAMGEAPVVPSDQVDFFWRLMDFYETWGIGRMLTWDLPVPLCPQWTGASGYHLPQIGGRAGLVVFVPWHLLRYKDLKFEDIVDRKIAIESPPEIREWLEGKPKNWGPERYATMLRIYVYLELALKRRYLDKIKGNQGRLDVAFARYLSEDVDDAATGLATIEKVRRKMVSRLRSGK